MQEPVLLGQVRAKGEPNLDLSWFDALEPGSDRGHKFLSTEALADGLLEERVPRFSHGPGDESKV
jgi:hypothetical protein